MTPKSTPIIYVFTKNDSSSTTESCKIIACVDDVKLHTSEWAKKSITRKKVSDPTITSIDNQKVKMLMDIIHGRNNYNCFTRDRTNTKTEFDGWISQYIECLKALHAQTNDKTGRVPTLPDNVSIDQYTSVDRFRFQNYNLTLYVIKAKDGDVQKYTDDELIMTATDQGHQGKAFTPLQHQDPNCSLNLEYNKDKNEIQFHLSFKDVRQLEPLDQDDLSDITYPTP
jgi:hypothetical protein